MAVFKAGQRVVFTEAGQAALLAAGRSMPGAVYRGPADAPYAVGTVTRIDTDADQVTVAVDGMSGLGEIYTLDSWYVACPRCVLENVAAPLPPAPGKTTCAEHVEKKVAPALKPNKEETKVAKAGKKATTKTKEPKAAKAPTEKRAKAEGGAGRKPKWDLEAKITLLTKENPKREGSQAHKKFAELLKADGKTVVEFLALEGKRSALDKEKGWPATELRYNAAHEYIKISK